MAISTALCFVALSLFLLSVVVYASPTYGTLYQSYTCPYATSIAFYGNAPNNFFLSCYGYGLLRIVPTSGTAYNSYQGSCHGATSIAVNPSTGISYGACVFGGIVSWDSSSSVVTTLAQPSQCLFPASVAVNQYTNTVYAACGLGGGVISIVGTASPTTVLTAAQCPTATSVAVDSTVGVTYAACVGTGVVLLRSGTAPLTIAGTNVCASPQAIAVHYNADVVYAVCAPSGSQGASVITIIGDEIQSYPLGSSCSDPRSVAVDVYGDQIYVACGSSGGVVSLDPVSSILTTVVPASVCHTATSVAAPPWGSSSSYVYATCSSPFTDTGSTPGFSYNYPAAVIGINVKTTVIASTAVCPDAWDLSIDTYPNIVYVSCGYGAGILAASGNTYTSNFIANASVCNDALSLSVNPGSSTLYASCSVQGGVISLFNPNPSTNTGPLPYSVTPVLSNSQCWYADAMAVDTVNYVLYAGCPGAELGVNILTKAVTNTGVTLCPYPGGISVNPNTVPPRVYSACGTNNIVLNGTSVLLNNPAICSNPNDVVVNPSNGLVYVACYGNSAVLAILPNGTVTVATTSAQCLYPYRLTLLQYSGVVYVACYDTGIVSITTTYNSPYTVPPTFSVATLLPSSYCMYARGVAVNQWNGQLYALCGSSSNVLPSPALVSIYTN